jgi:hypothetical protein
MDVQPAAIIPGATLTVAGPGHWGAPRRIVGGPHLLRGRGLEAADIREAPLTVPCARCAASIGQPCRSRGGYQNSAVGTAGYHAGRWVGAATRDDDLITETLLTIRTKRAALRSLAEGTSRTTGGAA